jgi:hypothetical protein
MSCPFGGAEDEKLVPSKILYAASASNLLTESDSATIVYSKEAELQHRDEYEPLA